MGVFYPSCVFNLQLRFDEAFTVEEDRSPAAKSVPAKATQSSSTVEARMLGDLFKSDPNTFDVPAVRPLVSYGAQDSLTQVGARIPRTATIELNGFRQAHTFTATFAFQDLPIDPRFIRYCRAEIFLGLVSPENFAKGMVQVEQDGSRASVINTLNSTAPNSKLMFYGILDEGTVEHTEKGSLIHVSGRDIRGLLIDAKVDVRIFKDLKLELPIHLVVKQIISKLPLGDGINVSIQNQEWPDNTIPSPADADKLTRVRMGAGGQTSMSSPQGPGDQIGFWDLITKYCMLVGAVPYFVGKDLWIRPTKSLFQQLSFDGTTPFTGGKPRRLQLNGKVETTSIRTFVYGRNIQGVKFSRKYGGQKAPVIELFSIDTSSTKKGLGKMLIVQSPALKPAVKGKTKFGQDKIDAAKRTIVGSSGQVSQTDILRIPMPGIKSKPALQAIADNLRHEIGRQELGGSASTKDFASFNTDHDDDPDMLTLMPGDAIRFVVDKRSLQSQNPLVSEWNNQARRTLGEAIAVLDKRLDRNLARVIAATSLGTVRELQDVFRVKNVRYTVSEGGAVGIDFDFENFIEVRSDVDPPQAPITSKPKTVTTPMTHQKHRHR